MAERELVLDEPVMEEQSQALQNAVERADRAEAELAKLKRQPATRDVTTPEAAGDATRSAASGRTAVPQADASGQPLAEPASMDREKQPATPAPVGHAAGHPAERGVDALREDSMMAHLLDALDAGTDIGHYGRLVFAMVARHFMTDGEVVAELTKDPDFSQEQAVQMLKQVEGRDYNPPRRDRILQWQAEQAFVILPNPDDPDCGNVYKSLRFPKELYEHIGHYQEQKSGAA